MKTFTVYGLTSDDSDRVRYVGQTSQLPFQRLKNHLSFARTGHEAPVCSWIRYMLEHGKFPRMVALAGGIGSEEEALAVEKALISVYASRYNDLLNANCLPRDPAPTFTAPEFSEAMNLLRAIPSEARAEASRRNGKRGGRPKGAKSKKVARNRSGSPQSPSPRQP